MPRRRSHRTKPRHTSVITHFWNQVDKRGPDECWPWKGTRLDGDGDAYGVFSIGSSKHRELAHRFSLEIATGPIGAKYALHRCDNPPCVNPAHLYAGDAKQNSQDMVSRGRFPSHFNVYGRYTNLPLAEYMEANGLGAYMLSKKIGVTPQTVCRWLYTPQCRLTCSMRDLLLSTLGEELVIKAFTFPPEANPRLKILPEIEAAIVECKKSGHTIRRIAASFKLHFGTITRVLRRNGLVKANPRLSAAAKARHRMRREKSAA